MNTFRSMLRLSRPVANAATKRSMSAAMQPTMPNAASKGKNFNPKNFKEAWLSDVGAYPVMGVIVFACVFCTSYGFSVMFLHQDSRISKSSRKTLFRGELKNEGYDCSSLHPGGKLTTAEDEEEH